MPAPLTIDRRRELKTQAHALNPVVMIGKSGLSINVIEELDRALLAHELIKIKVQIDDRTTRNTLLEEICQQLNATPIQHIGKILIIYRIKPQEIDKKPVSTKNKSISISSPTKRKRQIKGKA